VLMALSIQSRWPAKRNFRLVGRATSLLRQKWPVSGQQRKERSIKGGRQKMAQSAPATAQTIEAYVGETMDAARMGPVHWQVLALVGDQPEASSINRPGWGRFRWKVTS